MICGVRQHTASVLGALVVGALVLELALFVDSAAALLGVIVLGWYALPGVLLIRRIFSGSDGSWGHAMLLGPILGLACSTLGLLIFFALECPALLALCAGPSLTWALVARPPRTLETLLRVPSLGRSDWAAILALLLLIPAVTLVPFARVGELLADGGRAYRAYFTADFVWAMSVAAELAKGDVPPANPFLRSAGLHYYWVSHLLSGAVYRSLQPLGVRLEDVILTNALGFSVAFMACFYWLVRTVGVSPGAAALGCAAGFLANSFEGLERLWVLYDYGLALETLRTINIDAVTRWFYQGMPVDGLQRLLLYQPHHLTGYALSLVALWVVARATVPQSAVVAATIGVLLGASFLFSTFTAIIVGFASALLYGVRLIRARAWRGALESACVAAAPIAVAVALAFFLGYLDPGQGSLLHFIVNPVAFRQWPLVVLLNFGPLLIGGAAGLILMRWSKAEPAPAMALGSAALLFYFFADVPDMGGVWVGWRAGHLLLMAGGVLSAVGLDVLWTRGRIGRWTTGIVVVTLVVLAVPTVIIDVFNAQDVENGGQGAGFPWTLVLSRAELEGLAWIKRFTPPDAVVQAEPKARDAGTWAYIPAFAERRMAAGLPISMIPLRPYRLATDNVTFGLFHAQRAKDAWEMAHFLEIDYVLVGAPERERYPGAVEALAGDPRLFIPRFANEALTVYEVAPRAPR